MNDVFNPGAVGVALIVVLKMGIGVVLGGAIGFERERHGRPAGLRTHMLVALGVVLFCVVSAAYPGSDPTRISAQVVTGIGFLGAGTILRMGAEVKGLTSAASIWATSAISMAVARGGPYLLVAGMSTLLAVITLSYIDRFEKRFKPHPRQSEVVVMLETRSDLHDLIEKLNAEGLEVKSINVTRGAIGAEATMQVMGASAVILQVASSVNGVIDVRFPESQP